MELFTAKSRGGVIVIGIFMYVTYVMAVTFKIEQGDLDTPEGTACANIKSCYITLMRLAFYDGMYIVTWPN